MPYLVDYQPSGHSFPDGEIVGGNTGPQELIDKTPDGGWGLFRDVKSSGRAVIPESVPTRIMWKSGQKLQDLEKLFVRSVSDRLRNIIELLEPNIHQFLPLEFVDSRGDIINERWYWQVCNRLNSVDGNRRGWHLNTILWDYPETDSIIFNRSKISDKHFWCDMYLRAWFIMSDEAMYRINEDDISGFRLIYCESH